MYCSTNILCALKKGCYNYFKTRLEGIWIRNLDTLAASLPPTPWDRFSCSSTQGEGDRLLFLVSIISAPKVRILSLYSNFNSNFNSNFYEIHYFCQRIILEDFSTAQIPVPGTAFTLGAVW
jgi:hypothetical protein